MWHSDLWYADIIPRLSASLSVTGSSLIIFLVLKSRTRLSSVYHRILLGMSVFDIIGSAFIVVSSLMLPKDLPDLEEYQWLQHSIRWGSAETCQAQGFLIVFGMTSMYYYNSMLCLHYACAIGLRMDHIRIQKYVEPILHLVPVSLGIAMAVFPLVHDTYNLSGLEPFCVSHFAIGCDEVSKQAWCDLDPTGGACDDDSRNELIQTGEGSVQCYRGNQKVATAIIPRIFMVTIIAMFLIITASFSLCLWRVCSLERHMKLMAKVERKLHRRAKKSTGTVTQIPNHPDPRISPPTYPPEGSAANSASMKNTKVVLWQAVAYTSAFVITIFFTTMRVVVDTVASKGLYLFFMPLQGFFNFIIFVSHKVYNHRRCNREMSMCAAIVLVFREPYNVQDPFVFTGLSIVARNGYLDEMNQTGKGDDQAQDDCLTQYHQRVDVALTPLTQGGGLPVGESVKGLRGDSFVASSSSSPMKQNRHNFYDIEIAKLPPPTN